MANTSRIVGLKPISQPFGNIRVNWYEAATGTALYKYHPVDLDSNGRVVLASPGTTQRIVGSIVGFADGAHGPIDDAQGYVLANPVVQNSGGIVYVAVADDPQQYFLIEEDTGGGALDAQAVNAGCTWTYIATTGNTNTGVANVVLDRSAVGTGTDMTLRLVRKQDLVGNAFGDYAKWVVQIYLHRLDPNLPGTIGSSNLV